MTLTRWIKSTNGSISEAPASPRLTRSRYEITGYVAVPADLSHLPATRLGIAGDKVVELPETELPQADSEWYSRQMFVSAILSLIPVDRRQEIAAAWQTLFFVAQITDEVNLLDPRVERFGADCGIAVADIRAEIRNLEMEGADVYTV